MKNTIGKIGQDNFVMKDCPFYLPKENIEFFNKMQTDASKDPYTNYKDYGNAFTYK